MSARQNVEVFKREDDLAKGAAEMFIAAAQSAITFSGRFTVALSGGSTPRSFLRLLATSSYAKRVDWSNVHLFWGDERCVAPTHAASNFRMVQQALIDHVEIPADNVHRMEAERDPLEAAEDYDRTLRDLFGTRPAPHFDLVLLGLGNDGHTASLFPGKEAVREEKRWVVAEFVEEVDMWRITITPPAINAAAEIAFVVCGTDKAGVVKRVIDGPRDIDAVPATAVEPTHGQLRWLLDEHAASELHAR